MATWTRTGGTKSNSLSAQGLIGLLGMFAGLCTVFALIVSMTDGWKRACAGKLAPGDRYH